MLHRGSLYYFFGVLDNLLLRFWEMLNYKDFEAKQTNQQKTENYTG